jgi:hypothetical protein
MTDGILIFIVEARWGDAKKSASVRSAKKSTPTQFGGHGDNRISNHSSPTVCVDVRSFKVPFRL